MFCPLVRPMYTEYHMVIVRCIKNLSSSNPDGLTVDLDSIHNSSGFAAIMGLGWGIQIPICRAPQQNALLC